MRGMILAAGRGRRMGEMTAHTPKPLIKVANRFLIEYAIDALVKFNIHEIVINVSYRAEEIKKALGNGSRYGVVFHYSEEKEALETGGGILHALPLLGEDPFIVLSSDIITDYPLQKLPSSFSGLAHLVLVDNPTYHPTGDFYLDGNIIRRGEPNPFTFANIGLYRRELFADCKPGKFRLADVLNQAIIDSKITGEYYQGRWHNIGTAEDLHTAMLPPLL